MVAARALRRRKLSTAPFWRLELTHNRGMNDTNPASTLARFLTLADTAEVLNVSASQAYALVRSGELPAIKVGGRGQWRVERSVLESYIEAKYEESRRLSLWNQSDYGSLPELLGDRGADPHR
jgi:excisionase family DNA binding protein